MPVFSKIWEIRKYKGKGKPLVYQVIVGLEKITKLFFPGHKWFQLFLRIFEKIPVKIPFWTGNSCPFRKLRNSLRDRRQELLERLCFRFRSRSFRGDNTDGALRDREAIRSFCIAVCSPVCSPSKPRLPVEEKA